MIAIVNYGSGNIEAFANIYKRLNIPHFVATTAADFSNATKLILPGVGAFDETMRILNNSGIVEVLNDLVLVKKMPVLGICVGMQLLSTVGFEGGECKALNVVPGKVQKFEEGSNIRVPHVGWNSIKIENDPYGLFDGIANGSDFYFTHSYHFVPELKENWMCSTEYGYTFASAIQKNKIIATQFHPEKSQDKGLRFLSNFFSM